MNGMDGFKRYLEESYEHAKRLADSGPLFGSGNRRWWDGCAIAYECALAEFGKWFEMIEEDDPAALRTQIASMREDMEATFSRLRTVADEAAFARQYLGNALNAATGRDTAGKGSTDGG